MLFFIVIGLNNWEYVYNNSLFTQGIIDDQMILSHKEAKARFNKLISFGKVHSNDEFKLDYFAVSLSDLQIWDDDLTKRNGQNCMNLIGLGEIGKKSLM